MEYMCLQPDGPRAKLPMYIINETETDVWGKPMTAPARLVGMINVHQAANCPRYVTVAPVALEFGMGF